ncbi:neurochondrin homolog [Chrysoperla carnea]|uniref:neurochondrin homolog n=1 Tax=Chrysoperla carnea TaxID=189513 RepID=UPI001D089921|nr:neurochondrin homolog [Chrysoperla carnea]
MADQTGMSDACKKMVSILKGAQTDTEKFAALFMVTKLVKGKDCNSVARKAIFEAIGFKFLKRLLLTSDVPVDCPPVVYKSVALSILTTFCNDPDVVVHPEMLENIPVFLDIVSQADNQDYDDNLIVVGEAYACLQNIAAYEPGQKALLEVGAITKMSEIYAQQSFQTDEALNLLVKLVTKFGANAWDDNPKPFHALINKIALDFETDHSERKFELATILNSLLFNCRRKLIASTSSDETWPISLFKGLNSILGSRIGKNQRNPALILTATIIDLLGIEWTLQDEEKPKTFFLLLLQLSAIEVRMLDASSFKQAFGQAELLTACFIILEASIVYIALDQLDLEQKEKQSIYTGFKGAFTALINILTKLQVDKNRDALPLEEKIFVYAMVRVLAAWLAQETSALRAQVYKLLPFLLSLANESFYTYRAQKLDEKKAEKCVENNSQSQSQSNPGVDVLRVMLPALCHLTVEDEARKILLDAKEDEVLYECLDFHWSIVNWKRPPVPKSERAKLKLLPAPVPTAAELEDMKDSRAAMISICNVFMNITVLEAKYVETSLLFSTLLRFIFNNLPELKDTPDNLVLHGNLAVLGLLLLKQQSKSVRKNDFSICRYIQATIRFLWDAYIVDESNDPTALVVAMAYKENWSDLMELWFLGMQTMSGVIAQIPWLSEFCIESGWCEGIIDTLKKVKLGSLQPNVKLAYEDFLCQLVDANEAVIAVLKKCDALKVCRNHRFMDLGKKLFGD